MEVPPHLKNPDTLNSSPYRLIHHAYGYVHTEGGLKNEKEVRGREEQISSNTVIVPGRCMLIFNLT